ncbi:MAG: hypothetical protein QOD60_2493 [Solirubrobacterales bacterium]|jgi:hypothetical protein|nr:hypothetical protein [Solirubrobacterales bacterium]
MAASAIKEEGPAGFRSARQMRRLLDEVLTDIDDDPVDGPRLRAAAAPLRLEFTDLKVRVDISAADRKDHWLEWSFSKRSRVKPGLHLTMDSTVGNRFLQGKENPAIALVRGRMSASTSDAGAALRFFPAAKPLFAHYRKALERDYPQMLLD